MVLFVDIADGLEVEGKCEERLLRCGLEVQEKLKGVVASLFILCGAMKVVRVSSLSFFLF